MHSFPSCEPITTVAADGSVEWMVMITGKAPRHGWNNAISPFFFLKFTGGDGHNFNHSEFSSLILIKGVRGFKRVRFPHFIPISKANQSIGSGSKQLWDRLRLSTEQSFPAESIAEPWNRLPGKKRLPAADAAVGGC